MLNWTELASEVEAAIDDINVWDDGERIYSNYQKVTGYILRFTEIRNQIAALEISGEADAKLKKFRTLILDPTIERFEKVANYESRKITAKQIELELDRR